jgi:hypothetical protein
MFLPSEPFATTSVTSENNDSQSVMFQIQDSP